MLASTPGLVDGSVRLRPWADGDIQLAVDGHDDIIAAGFDQDRPPSPDDLRALVAEWDAATAAGRPLRAYVVCVDDRPVGNVEVTPVDGRTGALSWTLWKGFRGHGYATRAVRLLIALSLRDAQDGGLGLRRVEAYVDPRNERSVALAERCGLRRTPGGPPADPRPGAAHLTFCLEP